MIDRYTLPTSVDIDGTEIKIRDDCDYRVVLKCFRALNDEELTAQARAECALIVFYADYAKIKNIQLAVDKMVEIFNAGEEESETSDKKLMDWEQDFKYIAPAVSRVLGYDVRSQRFTHWWTFLGAYMEIGECSWNTILSIRTKKAKGKKLETWEQEFYREHKKEVDLKTEMTAEEEEALNSPW